MAHSVLDILTADSYPFGNVVPEELRAIIHDMHVVGMESGFCSQAQRSEDGRVFLALTCYSGSTATHLYADITTSRVSESTAPLVNATGSVFGWIIVGAQTHASFRITGNFPISPAVFVAYSRAQLDPVNVVSEEALALSLDTATNTIFFDIDENLYTRAVTPLAEKTVRGDVDVGIFEIVGLKGPEITLQAEDADILPTLDESSYLEELWIAPRILKLVNDEVVEVYKVVSVLRVGNRDVFTYGEVDMPSLQITVKDSELTTKDALVTWDDGLESTVFIMEKEYPTSEGVTKFTQAWKGCSRYNPVFDGIRCSWAEGSSVAYPLDSVAVCGIPRCPFEWEQEES